MENNSSEPKVDRTRGPAKKPTANAKFYAVIVVLVMVAAAFAVLAFYHPTTSSGVSGNVVTTTQEAIGLGSTYSFYVNESSSFKNVSVWFGDGTYQLINSTGNSLKISHVYKNPGDYFILYNVNYGSSTTSNNLIPLTVGYPSAALKDFNASYGTLLLNSNSTSPVLSNPLIFGPGVNLTYSMGATTPANVSYQTVNQSMDVYQGANMIQQQNFPFVANNFGNSTSPVYVYEPPSSMIYYLNGLTSGYYTLELFTSSAVVNTTNGVINYTSLTTTSIFLNIPIFNHVSVPSSSSAIYTNAELAAGGYRTLDPAIAYDTVSNEILDNTNPGLLVYNGNSTTSFNPFLATHLPNLTNGGINNYSKTYTSSYTNEAGQLVTYTTHLKPYENYTFTIRANASFANGHAVTSYDVYYSLVRDLLFINANNPGWILGQYVLPGNYYFTNTYHNITDNITFSNTSNNLTIHFQQPVTPTLAFQVLTASGDYVSEASWFIANGAAITFTPAGFQAYKVFGQSGSYNTYIQNHVMADGPYTIEYILPGQEIVLQANPYYKAPGSWYPAPSIKTVAIQYLSNTNTPYTELKGGTAQQGAIPTSSWANAVALKNAGTVNIFGFPSLSVFFYNFNALVDTATLKNIDPSANVPAAMFTSPNARAAFAYAYNEVKYLQDQLGNPAYPQYSFGAFFAGIIPKGMAYYQTPAQLNASTGGHVPYFNLSMAQKYWNIFMEHSGKKLGLTMSSGKLMYNGAQVTLPIFYNTPDPVDQAGISTWTNYILQVTGIAIQQEPTPFNQLINYEYGTGPGTNPMPIYLLGWSPDYPFPTDYLKPMALPSSSLSVYPATDGMYPSWIGNNSNPIANATEVAQMHTMNTLYNETFSSAGAAQESYALQMDRMFINLTFQVELFQQVEYFIVSSHITPSTIQNYQENVMIGGGADTLYNFLTYTS
jgi:ABC-type transport system substrate-binding protein